ncbi:MAG: hypothetical protein AB2A00_39040 [Myxococcota bacterium]
MASRNGNIRAPSKRSRILLAATVLLVTASAVGLGAGRMRTSRVNAHSPSAPTPAECMDHQKNGQETDTDCGGPACPRCAASRVCVRDGDCASSVCIHAQCREPSCTDGVRNGMETDVDCGGGLPCPGCVEGRRCEGDHDCASGTCGSWLQGLTSEGPATCR